MELVSIKRVTLVCFLFIICCNARSSSFSESTFISKGSGHKHLANEKQLIKSTYSLRIFFCLLFLFFCFWGSTNIIIIFVFYLLVVCFLYAVRYGDKILKSYEVEKKSRAIKGLYGALNLETKVLKGKEGIGIKNLSKKANKGGVYGGGDLLRPRSKKGGSTSLRLNSYSSMAFKTLAIGLLFFVFFWMVILLYINNRSLDLGLRYMFEQNINTEHVLLPLYNKINTR